MLDKIFEIALAKFGPPNWTRLYAWFEDTLQKVGIAGVALGLYEGYSIGLFIGFLSLGISAIMALMERS